MVPVALEHWLLFDYNYIIVIPSATSAGYDDCIVVRLVMHVATVHVVVVVVAVIR